ncbi:hypothetical protein G9A89_023196 [Geosiphon pyriformis]|nr:hypothetical protein G9A89_023196 [Geosiphon pyriformis]
MLIRLQNQFSIIKQKDHEAVTTYLGQFNPILCQILVIERDYYTMVQVLNQFIKKLRSSILRSVRPRHPTSLQDAVALARDFESTEQEANHTQAVNLAINETSNIDAKITQLSEKLTQKIEGFLARTTETYQPPQWRENNNNSRYPQQQSWRFDPCNCYYCQKPGHIAPSYFSLMEDQSFDKSTPVKKGDIEQISQPFKQTKSNILLATITEDTTLATIFPFDINNLNTHSLFSGAAINQDKPITALYTDARVREIDIKLILESRSAGSIITKQLMDQLVHVSRTTKNGPLPPNTIADFVYWKDLDDQNDKTSGTTHCASHMAKFCQIKDSGIMCLAEEKHATRLGTSIEDAWKRALNRLNSYPHNDHEIWRMASTKAKGAMPEKIREIKNNPWTPKYNRPDYSKDDFFTNDPDTFQN